MPAMDKPISPAAAACLAQGITLNPYYEIMRDLGVCYASPWALDDCYLQRVLDLMQRRPEFAPFLQLMLTKTEPGKPLTHYGLRRILTLLFGFAIPTPEAVREIAALGSIVEIGAGTGYWSALLAGAGAEVHAYDNFSWELRALWYDVKRGPAKQSGEVEAAALLLCWPPYKTRMALTALREFRGSAVVYVGEGVDGCTGCDLFHVELARRFELETTAPSVRWPGLHDRVEIWKRRNSA